MKPRTPLLLLSLAWLSSAQLTGTGTGTATATGTGVTSPPPPTDTASSTPPTTTPTPTPTPTTTPPTTTPPPPTSTPTPTPSTSLTENLTTNSAGAVLTETQVVIFTPSPTLSASASATSQADSNEGSSGFGTGSIIGLSVAGGVALLALIGFFVWKFTRKRNNDFDDNEAIKWPELNAHSGGTNGLADSHPLPVHNTGRSGFDTSPGGSDTDDLSRVPSHTTYNTGEYNPSMTDPYAVPPLPHANPNAAIPYRDDPNAMGGGGGGYYDPYRGPVPTTFNDGSSGEAIAMTQMGGRMSPGPAAAYQAYDGGRSNTPGAGRASPGPQGAYGGGDPYGVGTRQPSPGPGNAYGGGRTGSPGPQAAYGGGGRTGSPGPQAAYGGGRTGSPGPQAAYDYGQRL